MISAGDSQTQRLARLGGCLAALMWVLSCSAAATAGRGPARLIEFNRDIRPILSENCFSCHGPDKNKRKAGLRLDRAEEATSVLKSGDQAVVPGDLEHSKLLKLITAPKDEDRMPPGKTGKRLGKAEVELLRAWIAQGAAWQEHWSYLAPRKAPLPSTQHKAWVRNEVDAFILARLEKEGLKPSPEADRHTLIRRATLDLTGLPPTIEEVDAFLQDKNPAAYEKVVDRLLGSTAFGERFAQWWLDLARFADSDGYHADVPRSMWQYRDYVIHAFNANLPFDQFTLEQLAGDLLPKPTLEQRIATAFNRNGMSSTEGGADPDEYMNKYVTDRVNTFGTVFLGSSIACTECHDHKYDQFTQREYYQLYDFFNRIPERGLDSDPAPPFVKVPSTEQAAGLARLTNEISGLEARRKELLAAKDNRLDAAQAKWEEGHRQRLEAHWEVPWPEAPNSTGGAVLTRLDDRSVLATGPSADQDTYEVTLKTAKPAVTALRLEALAHVSLPLEGLGRATNGGFLLTGVEAQASSADLAKEPPAAETQWGRWAVLGPFKAGSSQEVFDKAFIDEAGPDLAKTHDEGRMKWAEAPALQDDVPQPLWGETLVSYFHRTITVPSARYASFKLGTDGGAQVWLNGARLLDARVLRATAAGPEPVVVALNAGVNRLLLKVRHGDGARGFYFGVGKEPVLNYPVALSMAFADSQQKDHPVKAALDDKADTGWAVDAPEARGQRACQAVLVARTPVLFQGGASVHVKLKFTGAIRQQSLGRFRLALTDAVGWETFDALPLDVQTPLFKAPDRVLPAQTARLAEYYRDNFGPEQKPVTDKLAASRKALADLDAGVATIRVMDDMPEPRKTRIRVRGDYRNLGEPVVAGVPHILPPLPQAGQTNRLTLARWLLDPQHPLLARVMVNRFWAMYFGTGFVKTGNEFGTQGELPSHPDLLDWLARDFIDTGWDFKAMHKKLVMSATYRQSSAVTPELRARDPGNRLLARGPRFRLTAEVIRDCALDYAGLLDRQRAAGGPSVRPYQPAGLWEEKMFGGNRYEESKGLDLYRRSLYTLWKRTVLNPSMMTFDAPDRALCTEQRSITCTPLQAFLTLNEKGYVEAARVFAERILRQGGADLDQRLGFACKTVLARPPSARERGILRGVYADMLAHHQNDLKGALDLIGTGDYRRPEKLNELELAAWTGVANVLLNLDETITKE